MRGLEIRDRTGVLDAALGERDVRADDVSWSDQAGRRVASFVAVGERESSRDQWTPTFSRPAAVAALGRHDVADTLAYRSSRANVLPLARDTWAAALAEAADRAGVGGDGFDVAVVDGHVVVVGAGEDRDRPVEAAAAIVAELAQPADSLPPVPAVERPPSLPEGFPPEQAWWEPADVRLPAGARAIRIHRRAPLGPEVSRHLAVVGSGPSGTSDRRRRWHPTAAPPSAVLRSDVEVIEHRLAEAIGPASAAVDAVHLGTGRHLVIGVDDDTGALDDDVLAAAAAVAGLDAAAVTSPAVPILVGRGLGLAGRWRPDQLENDLTSGTGHSSLAHRPRRGTPLDAVWRHRVAPGPVGCVRSRGGTGGVEADPGADPALVSAMSEHLDAHPFGRAVTVVAEPHLVLAASVPGPERARWSRLVDRGGGIAVGSVQPQLRALVDALVA